MTIRQLLESAEKRLLQAGFDDAPSTVRIVAEEVLGLPYSRLLLEKNREAGPEEAEKLDNVISRLLDHEPLAYILGKSWFMDLELMVTENVLVPRPETELLAEWVLTDRPDGPLDVLDLCTGSGCLLLSLLVHRPQFMGVGTDLSDKALPVARTNAQRLKVDPRAEFCQGDLWKAVPQGRTFDLIVCNPPYITLNDMQKLDQTVLREPSMALYGGPDGLDFYRRLADQAGRYLKQKGRMYLEIGYDQGASVPELFRRAGFSDIQVRQDYAGLDRMVRIGR